MGLHIKLTGSHLMHSSKEPSKFSTARRISSTLFFKGSPRTFFERINLYFPEVTNRDYALNT